MVSSVAALLTINIPGHFLGWCGESGRRHRHLASGRIDPACATISSLSGFISRAPGIDGPAGPRFIPAVDMPLTPIRGSGESENENFHQEV